MISPAEPLSVNPSFMDEEKRNAVATRLRSLKGETPWEDILFRRAEAQLIDAAMDEVRMRRKKESNPEVREVLTQELNGLKAEKADLFVRINAALGKAGR